MARCHEQAAAPIAAETEICATLRQIDPADRLAGRVEDHHAVVSRAAAPAAPQIAVDVDAQSIGYASALDGDERSPVGELRAVIDDVVNAKCLRRRTVLTTDSGRRRTRPVLRPNACR